MPHSFLGGLKKMQPVTAVEKVSSSICCISSCSMKNKLFCLFFPVSSGIFTLLVIIMSVILIDYNSFFNQQRDNSSLLQLIVILIAFAHIFQAIVILPFWAKFGKKIGAVPSNIIILALVLATIGTALLYAIYPSYDFFGPNLFQNILFGFVLLAIYWGINLHVLHKTVKQ